MSSHPLRLRAPLLRPGPTDDAFTYLRDAAVLTTPSGIIDFIGPFSSRPTSDESTYARTGLLIPPLLDCHIHIPQHPIRGHFLDGTTGHEPGGPLLAGLARNVFPTEMRCADDLYTRQVVAEFLRETRDKGTHGGVAFMTAHPAAARIALEHLPPTWRVGLVLMDQLCPDALKLNLDTARAAMTSLAQDFGQRFVVTDRFAVACSTPLRSAGAAVASQFHLDTQTHLAEQPGELETIRRLYPDAPTYAHVYERDGLLSSGSGAILAHCIHMSPPEWELLAKHGSRVAHCPVSNTELRSGTMPLHHLYAHDIDYALCTDVGASPTTSLLCEMTHFLAVHANTPGARHATPSTALWRATLGARRVGKIQIGGLAQAHPFAATEIRWTPSSTETLTPDDVIRSALLADPALPPTKIAAQVADRCIRLWP